MKLKIEEKSVTSYFEDRGFNYIGIYGMDDFADRLLEDLDGSSTKVDYGIDKDANGSMIRIAEVYFPEDVLPLADIIFSQY